ncbi:hypothetical protein, conserved, partial [Eimeria acervulina]
LDLSGFTEGAKEVLWDGACSEVLLVITARQRAIPFVFSSETLSSEERFVQVPVLQLQGRKAVQVGVCCSTLDAAAAPVALYDGTLYSVSACGNLTSSSLAYFSPPHANLQNYLASSTSAEPNSLTIRCCLQLIALGRVEEALRFLEKLYGTEEGDSAPGVATDCFEAVGWSALERLDLPTACSAFAAAQRSDLVFSLCSLEDVEEIAALKGHLKARNHQWAEAAQLLLNSGDPEASLEMACEAGEWQLAVELAEGVCADFIFSYPEA